MRGATQTAKTTAKHTSNSSGPHVTSIANPEAYPYPYLSIPHHRQPSPTTSYILVVLAPALALAWGMQCGLHLWYGFEGGFTEPPARSANKPAGESLKHEASQPAACARAHLNLTPSRRRTDGTAYRAMTARTLHYCKLQPAAAPQSMAKRKASARLSVRSRPPFPPLTIDPAPPGTLLACSSSGSSSSAGRRHGLSSLTSRTRLRR